MPLHGNFKAFALGLHGLQYPVRILCCADEPRMRRDGLMVMTRRNERRIDEGGDAVSGVDRHRNLPIDVAVSGMSRMPEHIRQVLDEGAPGVHCHDLHTPTDSENRQCSIPCRIE